MNAKQLIENACKEVISNKNFREDFPKGHPMRPFVHKLSNQSTGNVGEHIVRQLRDTAPRTPGNDAVDKLYGKLEIKTATANWVNQIKPENDFDYLVLVFIEPNRLTVLAISKEDLLSSEKVFVLSNISVACGCARSNTRIYGKMMFHSIQFNTIYRMTDVPYIDIIYEQTAKASTPSCAARPDSHQLHSWYVNNVTKSPSTQERCSVKFLTTLS